MTHMTNPLATPDQLYQRRSFSALPTELQDAIFFSTQCVTQAAGVLLHLPQSTTAQANVLLARYWLVEPFMSHDYEFSDISAATLYLTAKLGPTPRSPRDITNVYTYLLSASSPLLRPTAHPLLLNDPKTYYLSPAASQTFQTRLLSAEAHILYTLSFNTHVALPHPLAITYLQALDFLNQPRREPLAKRALAHLNTALLSPQMLYLTNQPNALAVAAVYSAARDVGAKMPECAWWEVFDVDREELGFLVVGMRSVEGWARKMREDVPAMAAGGMITRADIEDEMRRRGLHVGNGHEHGHGRDGVGFDDAEAEMARKMDEKMAQMEEGSG
ncbi:cyclin-like protein [Podospora appendiculata]|uniref:Cyclin-like protein n=1 Tax=Podospora appendiculata TaxID=314037 RepID=A0AAE0X7N2_9PEZI|nr:cyclin-like protein [Podospora appendiculata]